MHGIFCPYINILIFLLLYDNLNRIFFNRYKSKNQIASNQINKDIKTQRNGY